MTTIKERRFNVSLWTAIDNFSKDNFNPKEDLKRDKFICELKTCSINFAISSIPSATATPLFGQIINTDEEDKPAEKTIGQLLALAEKRKPVIISLKVTQSFSSENNQPDTEHWDFKADKKPDSYGQYVDSNDYIDIFIGFLCPFTVEMSATGVNVRLIIQHWLGALANVSLLTPACNTSTPMSLAVQYYCQGSKVDPNAWLSVHTPVTIKEDGFWKGGIYPFFNTILDKFKERESFSQRIENLTRYALAHINGDKLIFKDDLAKLSMLIEAALRTENYKNYINVSTWDSLVGYFCPSFLMDLCPGVKTANLIPSSGTVNINSLIELKDEDIFQITASFLSSIQLSQLICVASGAPNTMGGMQGANECKAIAYYPSGNYKKEGFTQTISCPEWLVRKFPNEVLNYTDAPLVYALKREDGKVSKTAEQVEESQKKAAEIQKINKEMIYEYTRAVYLIQAYNRTSAHIVLPFRLDVSIGASICCTVHNDKKTKIKMYGIITGINLTLRSGSSPPITQLTVSAIRPGKIVNDPIENPSDSVGFYTEKWEGKDIKLYD